MIRPDRRHKTLGDLVDAMQAAGDPTAWTLIADALNSEIVACFDVPGEPVSKERARVTGVPGEPVSQQRPRVTGVPGEPASKARARVTGKENKRRAYTPAKTRDAQDAIAWAFRRARPGWGLPDPEGTYGVYAVFFAGDHRRRDGDNMIKLVLDACNKVVWADDSQASETLTRVVRGAREPHSMIVIYRALQTGEPPSARGRKRAVSGYRGDGSGGPHSKTPRRLLAAAPSARTQAQQSGPGAGTPTPQVPGGPLVRNDADEQ